jgi:hypothetical protein
LRNAPVIDALHDVVVGGDDHPHPVLARPVGAEGMVAAVLQEAQQFHLGGGGEIADLIEE